jgi:ABC-2 type transport system permease protein
MTRIAALLSKELADLRQTPTVFLPAALTGVIAVLLPVFVAVIVPALVGERLSDSSDFEVALEMFHRLPEARSLDPEAAIQAYIFQQFLVLLIVTPVAGSMAVAASSVIGEKQARTLEPLLATPLTTFELLAAKVLGALVPAVSLSFLIFVLYVTLAGVLARPGVAALLVTRQSLIVVFVLGPLAALSALQLAVCVSSRVNDARSAQQIGALIILPISGLLVAQLIAGVVLGIRALLAICGGLVMLNLLLMRVGIALFDRESILTRWK